MSSGETSGANTSRWLRGGAVAAGPQPQVGASFASQAAARLAAGVLPMALWASISWGLLHFLVVHAPWLVSVIRAGLAWLTAPHIAGPPAAPPDLIQVGAFVALAFVAADRIVRIAARSFLEDDWGVARFGLDLVLGLALIGLLGTLALIAGQLSAAFLWIAASVLVGASILAAHFAGPLGTSAGIRAALGRTDRAVMAIGAAVVLLSLVHSYMSPVTAWDSTVYHAAAAKLWFFARPSPPIIAGPSVGVEISSNYPPLFPAFGAAADVVAGHLDDLYLRLMSPLLLAGLLIAVHGLALRMFNRRVARWAVLLTAGCPFLVAYVTWTTSYLLLTALTFLVLLCSYAAAKSGDRGTWLLAGVCLGLAMLTHFFGVLAVPIGFAAHAQADKRHRSFVNLALFMGSAAVVAGPWFVRNWYLLGDPLYPIGSPPFHGINLTQPMWAASQSEITSGSLSSLGADPNTSRLQLALIAVFHPMMLTTGLLAVVIALLASVRDRKSPLLFISSAATLLIVFQLAIGWFWLRSLLPAVPITALATAAVLSSLLGDDVSGVRGLKWPMSWPRAQATVMARLAVGVAAGVALLIAAVGPYEQDQYASSFSPEAPLASVSALGSNAEGLWHAFGGDYLAWRWLDRKLRPQDRVATFEIRWYWFGRPGQLFYLDGSEATDLMRVGDPAAAQRLLAARGVKFVVIPGWALNRAGGYHPGVGLLPFLASLGSHLFPLVAAFAPTGGSPPTTVYSVGGAEAPVEAGVYTGQESVIPSSNQSYWFPPSAEDERIYVPMLRNYDAVLSFDYSDASKGLRLRNVTGYNISDKVLADQGAEIEAMPPRSGWTHMTIQLDTGGDYVTIQVLAPAGVRIRYPLITFLPATSRERRDAGLL